MGILERIKSNFTKKQIEGITQKIIPSTEESDILKIISKWRGSQSQDIMTAITVD